MSRVIKKFSLPIVIILFFLLSSLQTVFSYDNGDNRISYDNLIQLYTEWLDLEGRVFKKLSFKLSPFQLIKKGYSAKLILEDNLGRKWIFKPAYRKKTAPSIFVYRLYKGLIIF